MALRQSPALKRFVSWCGPTILTYGVLLGVAVSWLATDKPDGVLLYAVAMAPSLPIVALVGLVARYLREETDEYVRAMVIEALLWGTALALAATTIWGFLEESADAPHIPLYWVFPVHCAGAVVSLVQQSAKNP